MNSDLEHRPASNIESSPPILIISCPRSGSTLLRYILDTHPDICAPAELELGRLCRYTQQTLDALLPAGDPEAKHPEKVAGHVRRTVSGIMERYAQAKGKQIWCEKTPTNVRHLKLLLEVFPNARFLCLFRNCMDYVQSSHEVNRFGFQPYWAPYLVQCPGSTTAALVQAWIDDTSRILQLEKEFPSRCFRIRYESLVSDPMRTLPPMFEFLGVEWIPDLPQQVFSIQHDDGAGDMKVAMSTKIHSKSLGRGWALPLAGVPEELIVQAERFHEELHYPPLRGDGKKDWGLPSLGAQKESVEKASAAVSIGEVFSSLFPERLRSCSSAEAARINTVCKFIVGGEENGTWFVTLTADKRSVESTGSGANCTLSLSSDDLLAMAVGELNATLAYLEGKVRISGSQEQAVEIGKILFVENLAGTAPSVGRGSQLLAASARESRAAGRRRKPIFVFSCPGAGSVLMRRVLEAHPQVFAPAHANMGRLCQYLKIACEATLGLVVDARSEPLRKRFLVTEIRRIVFSLMDMSAASSNELVWCDVSPLNLLYADVLYEIFPEARFLCLHRHSIDTVHCLIEGGRLEFPDDTGHFITRSAHNIVAAMMQLWIERTSLLINLERRHPGKGLRICYESFAERPTQSLNAILRFLRLDSKPELIDVLLADWREGRMPDLEVAMAASSFEESLGLGSSIPRERMPEDLVDQMNHFLRVLDYPQVGPDWDVTPSPYKSNLSK